MRQFTSSILILLITAGQGSAFAADNDRISRIQSTATAVEQLFEAHAFENHLPGLSYGVVAGGELVLSGSFGYSNLEEKIPADTRTMFRIASMSKSFTALAILQLRDTGKLSLDEPAETYLPELEKLTYLTTDAPRITVRHLLTHASGFPEDNPWGDRQLADSDQELMQLIENGVSFSNAPGITYEYANLGFALLGQIVQRVSGMPFTEYMAENVFEPLGMASTVWEYENAPAERLALGRAAENCLPPFLCVVNIRVCRRNIEVTEDDELFVLPQLILQETAQRIEPVELVSVFLGTDCLAIRHI